VSAAVLADHPEVVDGAARRRLPDVPRGVDTASQRNPLADRTVFYHVLTVTVVSSLVMVMMVVVTVRPTDVDSASLVQPP